MGAAGQAMKRIPRIKFPARHPKTSRSAGKSELEDATAGVDNSLFSMSSGSASSSNQTMGGKASLQPGRTPVSEREIEAILMGGCM